ncbi:MAG TPA: FAD-dependent oxidoreductase [Streptosporangiaceae bacterium]|nr:FAD-dependent oxidoreductase [Streptosporangiaceae bacterium]
MRTQFVIIGAGLVGLSAAWALSRRGHEVVVLDQAQVGHADGGSHGSCRIFRYGYENPEYVRLVGPARDAWTRLEEASGERLLKPTPQLTFGPLMGQVHDALRQAGAPCELMTEQAARERFPGIAVSGEVLLEPDSAVISADRALTALAGQLRAAGQSLGWPGNEESAKVTGLQARPGGLSVSTAAGTIDADVVLACAGPWTGALLGGTGITVPGSASMEQVGYLAPAVNEEAGAAPADPQLPIFIHYGGDFPYGLPVPGSICYKVGIHFGGPPIDPDRQDHAEHDGLREQIQRTASAFLPGFDPVPVSFERCIYDNSPDTDFIVDRSGDVVIGCGTSGHGFKFGPLIGEWLAGLATGSAAAPAWFGLGRF